MLLLFMLFSSKHIATFLKVKLENTMYFIEQRIIQKNAQEFTIINSQTHGTKNMIT